MLDQSMEELTLSPPILRQNCLNNLTECYSGAFVVDKTIFHDLEAMVDPYILRDDNGNVLIALIPAHLVEPQFSSKENDDIEHLVQAVIADREHRPPKDLNSAGNTFDWGMSSSDMNGTGTYLHRFDTNHNERGGSVKNVLLKGKPARLSHKCGDVVSLVATKMERLYHDFVVGPEDRERDWEFPSIVDLWHAADRVARESGLSKGIQPPFGSCLSYSSASVGTGNSSRPHNDTKNASVITGGICDGHVCLTKDTGHVIFVVHTKNKNGHHTAHIIPQVFMAATFFRGNNCRHMACDLYTWYHTVGHELLDSIVASRVQSIIDSLPGTFSEIQTQRVWMSCYCKASMYDLAWELRNYQAALKKPETYTMRRGKGDHQVHNSRRSRQETNAASRIKVQAQYGDRSPFSLSYN